MATNAALKVTNGNDEWKSSTICSHTVLWWIDGWESNELEDAEEEHIRGLLNEDYVEGELCVTAADGETQLRGYWKIQRP